jgi:DNA-binding transcriptional ArsR family regulator
MTYERVFAALADPSRLRVFEQLKSGPLTVGEIARVMPISRPAVSQHLKALKDAGLIVDRSQGTRRLYSIDPQGLASLRAWLDEFWLDVLGAFQEEAERSFQLQQNQQNK